LQKAFSCSGGGIFDLKEGQLTDVSDLCFCLYKYLSSQDETSVVYKAEDLVLLYLKHLENFQVSNHHLVSIFSRFRAEKESGTEGVYHILR
jgi:hypothetical protein